MSDIKHNIIYVYITTNLSNGMQYIGMHRTKNVDDDYLGSGIKIMYAIKKYGKQNFKREIICFCDNDTDAYSKESFYIEKFNTLHPNGYNISPKGGNYITGCFSEDTIRKMSEARIGVIPWNKGLTKETDSRIASYAKKNEGKKRTLEQKSDMSKRQKILMKDRKRNKLGWFSDKELKTGEGISQEALSNISNSHKGKRSPAKDKKYSDEARIKRGWPVYQCDLDGNVIKEWHSSVFAANDLGLQRTGITACAKGRKKTHGGFTWKYKKVPSLFKIEQYDLDFVLLREWDSVKEASISTNISAARIRNGLRGGTVAPGGFIWKRRELGENE